MAFCLDEAVHIFVSHVEQKLKEARGKLTKMEDIERAQQNWFENFLNDRGKPEIKRFGPDEKFALEHQPEPPPGTFADPATRFKFK